MSMLASSSRWQPGGSTSSRQSFPEDPSVDFLMAKTGMPFPKSSTWRGEQDYHNWLRLIVLGRMDVG